MRLFFTLAVAGMMLAIPGMAQKKTPSDSQDSAYAEAIRFEKAKAAADARQAKLEAEHPCGCATPAEAAAAANNQQTGQISQRASNTRPSNKKK